MEVDDADWGAQGVGGAVQDVGVQSECRGGFGLGELPPPLDSLFLQLVAQAREPVVGA
ncbi:hypothetical protein ACFRQM_36285 [Streptomyces sp. NPDC056831]|uniref:hypothetical protein n=1 Tax=Streptomyces sp. NPDC056831 TaxID=3345954 RepID=UPI0036746697